MTTEIKTEIREAITRAAGDIGEVEPALFIGDKLGEIAMTYMAQMTPPGGWPHVRLFVVPLAIAEKTKILLVEPEGVLREIAEKMRMVFILN